jgi:hypothetical protein
VPLLSEESTAADVVVGSFILTAYATMQTPDSMFTTKKVLKGKGREVRCGEVSSL